MIAPEEVTRFWFGDMTDGLADDAHRRHWFAASPARDAEIGDRFGQALATAAEGGLHGWLDSPRRALALVIVCDQFSRQIHRATPDAYGTDPLALDIARSLVDRGADEALSSDERAFLYMPFQHSETRLDQHAGVGLYSALRDVAPAKMRHHVDGFLDSARQHRDIVLRFGRFPHRNAILGRASTEQELAFLKTAPSFGQRPSEDLAR